MPEVRLVWPVPKLAMDGEPSNFLSPSEAQTQNPSSPAATSIAASNVSANVDNESEQADSERRGSISPNVTSSGGGVSASASGNFGARTPTSRSSAKQGKQQVKPFTKESLERLENKTVQLVREYGFQPRRKVSVEDGSVLPNKFEPFPRKLYGRPLEEIDNFIYDEVRRQLIL